jgi:hypothetical protein
MLKDFCTLVLLTFWVRHFVMGAVLGILEYLAASLAYLATECHKTPLYPVVATKIVSRNHSS